VELHIHMFGLRKIAAIHISGSQDLIPVSQFWGNRRAASAEIALYPGMVVSACVTRGGGFEHVNRERVGDVYSFVRGSAGQAGGGV